MSLIAGNLGVVSRLLDANNVLWAVCAGAAAHLYGDRRPIQDVDLLVVPGQLPTVVKLLQQQQKAVQFDGQRILWRGIKAFDDLSIRQAVTYPFTLDELAQSHRRRMPLLGSQVQVLSPEDVILHKLILNRGASQGKHDMDDVRGVVRRQKLDRDYLQTRIERMNAGAFLPRLVELGVEV